MRGLRQGRFNSNYKGGCPVINILSALEWDIVMKCDDDQIELIVNQFNKAYMQGTYPSRLDVPVMIEKIREKRKNQTK